MVPSGILSAPVLVVLTLVLSSCGGSSSKRGEDDPVDRAGVAAAAPAVRVVAAGDIACRPSLPVTARQCRQAATASLARSLRPDLVLTLGDLQYESGSAADFRNSYDKSWGTLLTRTRPAIGNHEYKTPGAAGYYSYFRTRQPGPPGYYRVRAGAWQVYVLNSNCGRVSCPAQAAWLDRQMRAHPSRCSLISLHHARYSSFRHGNNPAVTPLWRAAYRHRNDLVLSGHDHGYERFRRMDATGHVQTRRGMLGFIVGSGGRSLYPVGNVKTGSAYRNGTSFGVLRLNLRPQSYDWGFHTIGGKVLDRGSRTCL